ncbi:hypothetical protein ACWOC1_13090 [Enterococcus quebecensis]|uniref:hypothetical protein n=1 Tax=Enterococcus quebecensis TaxID=903983 RepID=UPI00114D17A4|nr:hypothetical protein [Enterococcus quebecensis]
MGVLFLFSILHPIFIIRYSNNWLSMGLFLYLENSLVILAWLFTHDLLFFLVKTGKVPATLYQQFSPFSLVAQQLLLLLLILLIIKLEFRYKIFDSISQIQKNYKVSVIILTILLIILSILRHLSVVTSTLITFLYLTFILLTLSTVFFLTAYLYSRYYLQQIKKTLLFQRYNNEMEQIALADEFRHDYRNILVSLMSYVEKGKTKEALAYIASITNYSKDLLEDDQYEQLSYLLIPSVQGLLIHFVDRCKTKNIKLTIVIPQTIQEIDISIRLIDFIRCLSASFDYVLTKKDLKLEDEIILTVEKENAHLYVRLTNIGEQHMSLTETADYALNNKRALKNAGLNSISKILAQYRGTSFSFYVDEEYFSIEFILEVSTSDLVDMG